MIQRIQTIYLILVILSLAAFQFAPVINYEAPDVNYVRNMPAWEVSYFMSGYFVFIVPILCGVAAVLALLAIFFFKNRKVQSFLCWAAIPFHLIAVAYIFYVFQTKETPIDIIYTLWNLTAVPPVLFLLLAISAIKKDEALVKSMDRLRD